MDRWTESLRAMQAQERIGRQVAGHEAVLNQTYAGVGGLPRAEHDQRVAQFREQAERDAKL